MDLNPNDKERNEKSVEGNLTYPDYGDREASSENNSNQMNKKMDK